MIKSNKNKDTKDVKMYYRSYTASREEDIYVFPKNIKRKYLEPRDYTGLTQRKNIIVKDFRIKTRIL